MLVWFPKLWYLDKPIWTPFILYYCISCNLCVFPLFQNSDPNKYNIHLHYLLRLYLWALSYNINITTIRWLSHLWRSMIELEHANIIIVGKFLDLFQLHIVWNCCEICNFEHALFLSWLALWLKYLQDTIIKASLL